MKSILFVYGEGGHTAQMNRLAPKIIENLKEKYEIVTLSDVKTQPAWSSKHYVTGEVRGKYSHKEIFTNSGPIKVISSLFGISKNHKVQVVVTTGPGIGIFAALFFKIRGSKVVHVESWSRFETASLTGKVMYKLADKFYIQNNSLKKLYPKAIYSGVL